jgi:hypothetical protein
VTTTNHYTTAEVQKTYNHKYMVNVIWLNLRK